MPLGGHLDPYQQLCHRDGGYRDVVFVIEGRIQIARAPLCVDEIGHLSCSTLSSTSEKRRAASVAEMSGMPIRYQIDSPLWFPHDDLVAVGWSRLIEGRPPAVKTPIYPWALPRHGK